MYKNCLVIKGKTRFLSFGTEISTENEFLLIKIRRENKFTAKKILKILEKNKILNLAFEDGMSEAFTDFFEKKINILKKSKILFSKIDEVVKKLSVTYGIKDGALELGIIAGYKTDIALKLIKNLSLKLKTVYFYSENKKDYKFTEDFYRETGIPVIIKGTPLFSECHIVLYLTLERIDFSVFNGMLIDIFDKTEKPGINDIRGYIKNTFSISDAVYLRLTNKPFDIQSFK